MGGAYPCGASSRPCSAPPDRGCHGHPGSTVFIGRVLQLTRAAHLWVPWEPWEPFGWPQGPMAPPFAGGGRYTRERLAGVRYLPGCSLGNPPRMAPPHSRGSTMNPLFSRVLLVILVPIFTDFSDFLGRILLPCCYSTCMLIFFVDSSSRGIATSDA